MNILGRGAFADFLKKNIPDKVRDQCQLSGKYRGTTQSKRNMDVTQKQSNFLPFIFQ